MEDITMKTFEGRLVAEGLKVGIIVARFNEFIGSKLLSGAIDGLVRHGMNERISKLQGYREHLKPCGSSENGSEQKI